ncbi:MAG: PAS domain S-box protein [Sulfurifustaceae bacterium]
MVGRTSERRRTDDAVKKSATRFHGIFARTNVGIALVDRWGRAIESNAALQQMFGCSGEQLRAKRFNEFAHREDRESVVAAFSGVLTGPLHETQVEARFPSKSNRIIWARLTISLLREVEGDPVCAVVILEDITERKRTEDAFRYSEFKFRALFESNIAPLQFWHADGRVLDANDAFLALIGFSRTELQAGRVRWDELIAPEYLDVDRQAREELIARKRPFVTHEKEYVLRTGRRVPVMTSLSLLPGHRDCGFCCAIDLTQQNLALKRSEESKALIKAVFSSLSGYIAVIDADGSILAVNEAWMEFACEGEGHPLAAGVGINYLDMCRRAMSGGDRNAERALAGIRSVLAGKRADFTMEYASGKRWLEMIVQPLRRLEGGAVISHIDITEKRQAEIETRNMRLELSHFARVAMMGELTGSLAHELSQPLTAILANAQSARLLLDAPTPDLAAVREIVDDIVSDEQRAGETIRRVRSLLKKSAPEYQLLDLNTIIVEVLGFINTEALTKNVAVAMQLAHDLPNVRGDRIQLQQVVLNLVLNALDAMKNTPSGERRLDVSSVRLDSATLQVSVKDTGTGIASEALDKIFDPFFTAKSDGLGMGLAICRSIVEAHGGRIWVTSNLGHGAVFRFTLPIGSISLT